MMKYFIHVLLWLILSISVKGQTSDMVCNLGFKFEISKNSNWGEGEPVITEIYHGSPAEYAGLQVNDIILEVNGKGTYLKPYNTIMSWFGEKDADMSLSVRNFKTTFKNYIIEKDCRLKNAINESQLAPVFSFYSIEDVQDRKFIIPVTTKENEEVDFFNYRTYDFTSPDAATYEYDQRINAIFDRVLSEMGLTRDTEDPDFIIETYYSYKNNPLFKTNSSTYGSYQSVWRFDVRNKRMVKIPVYSPSEPIRVDDVAYYLNFGYRFYDRKFVTPGKRILVWESDVNEKLNANYGLLDYLEMNLPLILKKFPYSGNPNFATYHVKFIRYNYTGISYDMDDLKTVVAVAPGSPAALVGIRPGDIVIKVQDQSFNHDARSLSQTYRRFIAETMQFRDENTKYTDANGFQEAMFWDITHYYNIAKEVNKKRYRSAFAYLFNFNQYVDWTTPAAITFQIDRDGENVDYIIKPTINEHAYILVH